MSPPPPPRPPVTLLRNYYKSGVFATFDLFAALCCPRAIGANAAAAAKCNSAGRCGMRLLWETESLRAQGAATAAVVHFVRHPIEMLVSAYLFALACQEPFWMNSSRLLPPVGADAHLGASRDEWRLAGLKFGRPWEREQLSSVMNLRAGESYCTALQRLSMHDGLRAEALRSATGSGNGIRQMLEEYLYLHGSDFHGRVVEVCNPKIDPRRPELAKATWFEVVHALNASEDRLRAMLPRFSAKFDAHRTRDPPCARQTIATAARDVLTRLAVNASALAPQESEGRWRALLAASMGVSSGIPAGSAPLPPWTCGQDEVVSFLSQPTRLPPMRQCSHQGSEL